MVTIGSKKLVKDVTCNHMASTVRHRPSQWPHAGHCPARNNVQTPDIRSKSEGLFRPTSSPLEPLNLASNSDAKKLQN